MRIALFIVIAVLVSSFNVMAQVISSANMGCTVIAAGGMACNGIADPAADKDKTLPKLSVTHFVLEPGAALDQPNPSGDCLIAGISGGDLLNEKSPFLHVSLEKDSVTLMPKGLPFRLRNGASAKVEFRLIEIRR